VKVIQVANRVRVSLSHAVLDDHLLAQHQPPHYPRSPAHDQLRETSDFDVELARVVVKNVGRTPIKIIGISFDVGRISPLALERRTIALAPIPFKGHATRAKARLEPFDETAVLLDVWAALHEALKAGRTVVLRASVQVSGQRSSTRSPWSQRWTVSPAQLSLRPWRSPEPATIAFEAVWRLLGLRQDAHFLATAIGLAVHSALENAPTMTVEDLSGLIEEQLRDVRVAADRDPPRRLSSLVTAHQVAEAFRVNGLGKLVTAPTVHSLQQQLHPDDAVNHRA